MKSFFKIVMANIVAILIIMALFVISFVFLLAISAFSGKSKMVVKDNSVLTLNLKNGIVENSSEVSISVFDLSSPQPANLSEVLQAIENAKTDNHIKGISIETDQSTVGITQLDDIRAALEDFKKSGKFVYGYGNTMSQGAYYLATVAQKLYMHPAGGVDLKGLSAEVIYFKDFLDQIGIGVEVLRHGKYKSAVEPYLTNKISDENKEQLTFMLGDIWGNFSKRIMTSRKIDSIQFKKSVDSLDGIIPDLALKGKLVDQLAQQSEYEDFLKTQMNVDKKDDLNKISIQNYISAIDLDSGGSSKNQIAILTAAGTIYSGKGATGIYSEDFIKEIKKLKKDDKVKAVVLRVNSPGGSANASDEILFELKELRKKKPLVVSMGDYAASGGYYISMAAQRIFSEPNTLTGSIGVFGIIPNAKDLAAKNKLRSDVVKTNENANMFSMINGLSTGSREMLQRSVEQTYKRFVHFVSTNRNKTFEQIDEVGGGHVWSGQRAKDIGLVDELGTLNDAVKYAAKLAKVKDYSTKSYPRSKSKFEQLFENLNEDDMADAALEKKFGKENYKLFQTIFKTDYKRAQMSTPFRVILD